MGRHWFPWRCTTCPFEPDEGLARPELSPTMSFGLPLLEASRDRGTGNLPDDLRVILLVGTRQRTEERGARCGADATHHEGRAYPASNIAPCVYPKPPRVRTTFARGVMNEHWKG
jgi:hypothetical protein